jgi:hypothetical protein
MALSWLPATTQGVMVGDYISTSFTVSNAISVFPIASPPGARFHQSMFATATRVTHEADRVSAARDQPQSRRIAPLGPGTRAATNR